MKDDKCNGVKMQITFSRQNAFLHAFSLHAFLHVQNNINRLDFQFDGLSCVCDREQIFGRSPFLLAHYFGGLLNLYNCLWVTIFFLQRGGSIFHFIRTYIAN